MASVLRLNTLFIPSRYELALTPNATAMTFSGTVQITGRTNGKQKKLLLHAKELNIHTVIINGNEQPFSLDTAHDHLIIDLKSVDSEDVTATISFDSKITKPMHGLYPCFARNGDIILATLFESHHAREVFPCIDEPEAKAVFKLQLTTPSNEIVLANTNATSVTKQGKLITTTFEDTPIMSTYLLAFVIGKLHAVKGTTKNNTEVRVWASHDHNPETLTFALDTAIRATEFFNEYFDTAYPLTKCDHVALPDFSSGAMENWGLITYREVCLIVDTATTSTNTKEYAATVIAHELSHQWFGNLVTMKWWDDLWLNESFATLMEYLAVDTLYPEWNVMLSFASQEALSAFWRDSIPGVQAVRCRVNHPDEISTLFDPSIVYAKGARLLLMAYNFVGKQAFKRGLRIYFERFAYGNTEGDDLWQALEDASGKQVKQFMNTWIDEAGFPLVQISQHANKAVITQQRFSDANAAPNRTLWPVPLSARPILTQDTLLTKKESFSLASSKYVRLNVAGGHYSVRYETEEHRDYITSQITQNKLSPSERLLALNDSLMQARAGYGSISETMSLLSALKNETEDPVWGVMSLCVSDARTLAESNSRLEQRMKQFAGMLVASQYAKLGWKIQPNEPLNVTKLRGIILGLATYSESPEVIASALAEYKQYETLDAIPADTRHIILTAAVRHGGKKIFNHLLKAYPTIKNAELQQDVCNALSSTKDINSIKLLLSKIKDQSFVRPQDIDRWIIYLLRNRKGRTSAWNWLTSNWSWIEENFGSDKSYDNYPRYAGRVFSSQKWLDKYNAFFDPLREVPSLKRNIEIGEQEIKSRIVWRERDEQKLNQWLILQSKSDHDDDISSPEIDLSPTF